MTHKLDKASAETLDKIKSKETVNLAQLLTYVFVVRKISKFMVHVFYVQTHSSDQTVLGFVLVDLLNPHCMLIHGAQALFKLYRLDLINHSSILVCAKKGRNHIINSLTSDWTFMYFQRWHSNSSFHLG